MRYNTYEGRNNSSADITYRDVRFRSYVDLVKAKKEEPRFNPGVSLWYFGNETNGRVEIEYSRNLSIVDRDSFTKLAGETLQVNI